MPSLREAHLRHTTYYEHALRRAYDLYQQGGEAVNRGLILFALEWNNIKAGQAWARANADAVKLHP